jgi:aminoglycoside phosphotransferase (APT) family kinase protein
VWVHGDLLPGNILVRQSGLACIIDWSAARIGDPACETMLAWSLSHDALAVYRAALNFDDATWIRGRGWTLQQAAKFIPYHADSIPDAVAVARRRHNAVMSDDEL